MNEIVKYNNKLNNFNYGRFSAAESDIFFTLIAKIKDGSGHLMMSFKDLQSLAAPEERNAERFADAIESTFSKYLNLKYKEVNGDITTITNVFQRVTINRSRQNVIVEVTPGMEDCVLMVSENFTRFELQEFVKLKSSYSKTLYRLLKQWRTVGKLSISIDDFRFKLDIPKSYRMTDIDSRVLKPAIKELSQYFKRLSCKKIYKHTSGKGRSRVAGFEFTFTPETVEKPFAAETDRQNRIAGKSDWKETLRYCPQCRRRIYSKTLIAENGDQYVLYGHLDYKTGPCSYTTYDYADLITDEQIAREQAAKEPETEMQKANKRKLRDMMAGMFKNPSNR